MKGLPSSRKRGVRGRYFFSLLALCTKQPGKKLLSPSPEFSLPLPLSQDDWEGHMANGLICFRFCHRELKEFQEQPDPLSGKLNYKQPGIKGALKNCDIFDWAVRGPHTLGYEKDGR